MKKLVRIGNLLPAMMFLVFLAFTTSPSFAETGPLPAIYNYLLPPSTDPLSMTSPAALQSIAASTANGELVLRLTLLPGAVLSEFAVDVFLDTDQNPATGFQHPSYNLGSEYRISYGNGLAALHETANPSVSTAVAVVGDDLNKTLTFSFPLALLGNDGGNINLVANSRGGVYSAWSPGSTVATVVNPQWRVSQVPQAAPYNSIDWPATQHGPVRPGTYLMIGQTYYLVQESWVGDIDRNGTDYCGATLIQCHQELSAGGLPLSDANNAVIPADLSGRQGEAISFFRFWPKSIAMEFKVYQVGPDLFGNNHGVDTFHWFWDQTVAVGDLLRIDTTYYRVAAVPAPINGLHSATLVECDQVTGVATGVPANLSGSVGESVQVAAAIPTWTGYQPALPDRITWPYSQHGPVNAGSWLKIGGTYYFVAGSSAAWSYTIMYPSDFGARLEQCDQSTGQSLHVPASLSTSEMPAGIAPLKDFPLVTPPAAGWSVYSVDPSGSSRIDWRAAQHDPPAKGSYLKIGARYYFVAVSGGSSIWNGAGYNWVDLQQCDQQTGTPLTSGGQPLWADLSGTSGTAIELFASWPPTSSGAVEVATGQIYGGSLNSLGEVVWSQLDQGSGRNQIFSSLRGQLTSDQVDHSSPAINNLGDLAWVENDNANPSVIKVRGIIGGQSVTVASGQNWIYKLDINDRGEVVWSQSDNTNGNQIFSNLRGQITSGPGYRNEPGINNLGDVVFAKFDPTQPGPGQIYRLSAGSTTPVAVTSDALDHRSPAINDGGEIVWAERDMTGPTSSTRLFSTLRGLLGPSGEIFGVDLNNCGDLVYTVFAPNEPVLYRLGRSAPCLSYPGDNDKRELASPVAFGGVFTGLVDPAANPVDWYRFDAAAGDTINITVNYDNRPPNLLAIGLYDGQGNLVSGPTTGNPLGIKVPAAFGGAYYLKLESQGGRFGYAVSLSNYSSNCGVGPCAEKLASGQIYGGSLNSLGEVVWSQLDQGSGRNQIFSSLRGQLTSDPVDHSSPAINNLGDLVWVENDNANPSVIKVRGIIGGQSVTVASGQNWIYKLDINDRGEVVWSQSDNTNGNQIFSNLRGQLTRGPGYRNEPGINNLGDVVFANNDPMLPGSEQIYRLSAGSTTPVAVTSDALDHRSPAISDGGEIVWAERDMTGPTSSTRLFSTLRGLLAPSGEIFGVDLNNCGDLVYTVFALNEPVLYRLGRSAPCLSYPGDNDKRELASPVAFGGVFTGLVDPAANPVDWYRFDAAAGDTIHVTVNYDDRAPNMLAIGLYDGQGNLVSGPTTGYPLGIKVPAAFGGAYYLKLESQGGRFGYAVSLSNYSSNCGAVPCPEKLASGQLNGASLNSLGEVVWSQLDQGSGRNQIFSSLRCQLTSDPVDHSSPAINNLGDLVWVESDNANPSVIKVRGIIGGQSVTVASSQNWIYKLDINDRGEVVWSQSDSTGNQIFSSLRGQLTSGPGYSNDPGINNLGDVVFAKFDPTQPGPGQIYRLSAGSTTPVAVTSDALEHRSPAINDGGEIVWAERDMTGPTPSSRLFSTLRGLLAPSGEIFGVDLNNCGDLVYTVFAPNEPVLYRLGRSTQCGGNAGPNGTPEQATATALDSVTTGALDSNVNAEGWYKFDAQFGAMVQVRVNYDNRLPNLLAMALYDRAGILLAGPAGDSLIYTVPATGAYYVRLTSGGGRFAYALSISRTTPLPELVFSGGMDQWELSGNDLGEVVWVQNDGGGNNQIYSSKRGMLTSEPVQHSRPVINNLGDVVWSEYFGNGASSSIAIKGIIAGQAVQLASSQLNIMGGGNDKGEVVWMQYDGMYLQVHSNLRGQLTNDPAHHDAVAINNAGDVVWLQNDSSGFRQIYKLAAGSTVAVPVTTGGDHNGPAINDAGEVVWYQNLNGFSRIFSSIRGQLTTSELGMVDRLRLDNCGGVLFSAWDNISGTTRLYRLGSNAQCVSQAPERVFALVVSLYGTGGGGVASLVPGIHVELPTPSGYGFFPAGSLVSLVATPDANSAFAGWFGACSGTGTCKVSMNAVKDVSAKFVPGQVAKPGSISVPASSATGAYSVTWAASATVGATYVLQESTDPSFGSLTETVNAVSPRTVAGKTSGTYYYRVKAVKAGLADSAWVSGQCVVTIQAVKPGWIWTPATSSDGAIYATWNVSSIPGVTYVLEEANNTNFIGAIEVYRGTALRSPLIPGHANGIWYLRVKAIATGYIDSAWVVSTGEIVAVQAKKPSWIWTSATSTDDTVYATWVSSTTPEVAYVLEEANNVSFMGAVEIYRGTALRSPLIPGHANGTWYLRVKAIATGYIDSAWVVSTGEIVAVQAMKPSWIWTPATSTDDTVYAKWVSSTTPGVTYVLEEANNTSFMGAVEIYRGTALRSEPISGHANGTWYLRVKAIATGYIDSAWVVSSGETVAVQTKKPSWIWTPATSANGNVYSTWITSTTPGVTYVVEESNNLAFTNAVQVYSGTALRSPVISGHATGTWYLRVKATVPAYIDSPWVVSTGCTVP